MAANLEWDGDTLLIGGLALELRLKNRSKWWEVFGSSCFGSLLDERWKDEESAKQDVITEVRRLLREAGVVVE